MNTLDRMLKRAYSKLNDRNDDINSVTVYEACEDKAELVVACMNNLTPEQINRFFNSIATLMFPDSKAEMMTASWHVAEHFDPTDNRYAAIIVIAMHKYSYTDYINELAEEKNCEDSESDNERNEYERSTLKTI